MGVLQMRLVVEASDYDEAVRFYRDVLGAPEELVVDSGEGARVTILDVGRATLELSTPEQVDLIDRVEVGRRVSPKLRVAFEVADAEATTHGLTEAGADLVAPPAQTRGEYTKLTWTSPDIPAADTVSTRTTAYGVDDPAGLQASCATHWDATLELYLGTCVDPRVP